MANVTITQLPAAGPIQGDELVPIVQNGQTVRSTTAAVAGSPVQTQTFITLNQEPTLNNSRALAGGTGVGLVDNGAQSTLQVTLNGASGSLEAASNGVIVKTGASTVTNRSIAVSGTGLAITNGDGVSGNPTVALDGLISAVAQVGGTGLLAIQNGTTAGGVLIAGTANEIDVANGNGQGGNPTISITDNPVIPGTGGMRVPTGTTAQQISGPDGTIRYNSDSDKFEGYIAGSWTPFSAGSGVDSFSAGTTGLTPSVPTTGDIVLDGVLGVPNGGSGATSLTGYLVGNGTSPFSAISVIPNAGLQNDSVTYNGVTVALGSSGTITAASPQALTIGAGLSGGSYDGSSAVTVAIDSTVATLTGTQTLTNKSISGATNTLSSIPNAALDNSSVTIGTTSVSLGGTSLTLGGLTSVAVTQDPVSALQVATKQYVDGLVSSGITFHAPVKYEVPSTTGNLNATYNQPGGPGVGIGATLTNAGTLAAFAPDGPTASPGDRVLIYNQTNAFENGVYTVTVVGNGSTPWVLTRATDADTYGLKSPTSLGEGDAFFIQSGNTGAGETYVCNTTGVITFGTTAITFVQVSSSQVYSAGTGLTLSGTQFSLSNTGTPGTYGSASQVPVVTTNAQGQVTGVTNTSIAISGSAVSGDISGNAANVTGIVAVANGGTGTTTPSLVAGSNVTITGTWPNQTVSASGGCVGVTSFSAGTTGLTPVTVTTGAITLAGTLASSNGGTGLTTFGAANRALYSTSASALTAGTLPVVAGGTGLTTLVGPNNALYSTGASTLTAGILPVAAGGNGTAFPGLIGGVNISISGCWPSQTINSTVPPVACATPTVAGIVYGRTTTCCFGGNTLLGHSSSSACIHGVAVGIYSNTANFGTAVGKSANACYAGVAVGINAFASSYSVALGPCVSAAGPNQTHIGPIRNVCSTSGLTSLFYNAGTKEIVQAAGGGVCCATPTAAGIVYGRTTCSFQSKTALGYGAGQISQGCYATAIGVEAGNASQGSYTVAVGRQAGNSNQGTRGIAVGHRAGEISQGAYAIAIGACAAFSAQGSNAIAIGNGAGGMNQPACSIALGDSATATGVYGIAIGKSAAANSNGIAIGELAVAPANTVVINASGIVPCGGVFSNQTHIGPIRGVGSCTGSFEGLFYCAFSQEVVRGTAGGGGVCCATPCVAGKVFGLTNTSNTTLGASTFACGTDGVALGNGAGVVNDAIAIGKTAYAFGCGAINIGRHCGSITGAFGAYSITIGRSAVTCSSASNSIAIGHGASAYYAYSVAIGAGASTTGSFQTHIYPIRSVCSTSGLQSLFYNATNGEVVQAAGGGGVCCATPTVAGKVLGRTTNCMFVASTALGLCAGGGTQGLRSVAVGHYAGNYQGNYAVAVGPDAGRCCQGNYAVAVGYNAGQFYSGCYSVSIGPNTGSGCANNSIALGVGTFVSFMGSCQTHIGPIRSGSGPFTLKYCPCTREVTYA